MPPLPSPPRRRLRVAFIPFYTDNPYQRALAEALRPLGCDVIPRPWLKGLLFDLGQRRERLDVVHLHWLPVARPGLTGTARVAFFLARLALLRRVGCRIVWTVHNLHHHEHRVPALERFLARHVFAQAHRVIAHTPHAAALVRRAFAHPRARATTAPDRVVTIPHGNYLGLYPNTVSPATARARLGLSPGAPVVLFLGNIRPYKGVDLLLAAFRALPLPAARLVIAGQPLDDAQSHDLRHLAAADPRVKLHLDFVHDDALQLYLNAADVVAFPYRNVLTSGAVILAMSFGRACLAPDLGCLGDTLDRRDGLLYDPADPTALGRTLATALSDSPRLAAIGRRNLALATTWSWPRIAADTAQLYSAALASPHLL